MLDWIPILVVFVSEANNHVIVVAVDVVESPATPDVIAVLVGGCTIDSLVAVLIEVVRRFESWVGDWLRLKLWPDYPHRTFAASSIPRPGNQTKRP